MLWTEFLDAQHENLIVNKPTYEPKDSRAVISKQQEEQSKQKRLDKPDVKTYIRRQKENPNPQILPCKPMS